MKRLLMTLGVLLFSSSTLGAPGLVHFNESRKSDGFVLALTFNQAVKSDRVGVQYVDDGIEIFVSGAKAPRAERTILVDDPQVASVGYSVNPKGLKVKIGVVPGIQAATLKDSFQFTTTGKQMMLVVGTANLAQAPVSTAAKAPVAAEVIDADLEAQLQALNKAADTKPAQTAAPTVAKAEKTESAPTKTKEASENNTRAASTETSVAAATTAAATTEAVTDEESSPVFGKKDGAATIASATAKSSSDKSATTKLALTFCVIGVLGAGAYFAAKKWPTKRTKGKKHMIQILSQSYLGPKRSLAVVQVAGETVLIGVTDSNISLIKTLALIDDEVIPDHKGKFVDALNNTQQEFDANDIAIQLSQNVEDEFTMQGLKSVVDGKLKNMRSF